MARYRNGAEGVEAARYSGPNFDQIESVAGADVEFRGGSLIVPTVDGPLNMMVGDWVVRRENGSVEVYSDAGFLTMYVADE